MNHEHASIAIRNQCGGFLHLRFLKKTERLWRFPGGKINAGEMAIVAAARELKEELGVEPIHLEFICDTTTFVDGNTWTGHWFFCDQFIGLPEIQEKEKHAEIAYFTPDVMKEKGYIPESNVASKINMWRPL